MSEPAIVNDMEKSGDTQYEVDPGVDSLSTIDPVAERRLLRKIDLHMVPIVWLMFLFSNLDRSNIGNAYSGGMQKDLNMTSNQYSVALLVFFIGYCLAEVPSNMLLSRLRPSVYLPAIMFVWGAVAVGLAGCRSYEALAGVRAVLGIAESGFSPGVIFLLSSWYRKNELARRFCFYWTGSPASGAVGGLLAGAIIKRLDGSAGLEGWRWLFIIEGIATCLAAVAAFFVLPDFPMNTRWLSEEEKMLSLQRLQADNLGGGGGNMTEDIGHLRSLKAAFTDWRTYVFIFLYTMCTGALTITYFIPTLVASLGYTGSAIQYMTVPIYGVCIVFILLVCFHSDLRQERAFHLAACGLVSAVCFAAIMATTKHVPQYVLLCFAAAGIWCSIPLILVWVSNVITWPAEKRAIAQAATNAAGNMASIYGAFLWPSHDAPRYLTGFGTTLAFLVLMAGVAVLAKYLFRRYPYPQLQLAASARGA